MWRLRVARSRRSRRRGGSSPRDRSSSQRRSVRSCSSLTSQSWASRAASSSRLPRWQARARRTASAASSTDCSSSAGLPLRILIVRRCPAPIQATAPASGKIRTAMIHPHRGIQGTAASGDRTMSTKQNTASPYSRTSRMPSVRWIMDNSGGDAERECRSAQDRRWRNPPPLANGTQVDQAALSDPPRALLGHDVPVDDPVPERRPEQLPRTRARLQVPVEQGTRLLDELEPAQLPKHREEQRRGVRLRRLAPPGGPPPGLGDDGLHEGADVLLRQAVAGFQDSEDDLPRHRERRVLGTDQPARDRRPEGTPVGERGPPARRAEQPGGAPADQPEPGRGLAQHQHGIGVDLAAGGTDELVAPAEFVERAGYGSRRQVSGGGE